MGGSTNGARGLGPNETHVRFIPEETIRTAIHLAYRAHANRLRALVPDAEMHHIGSTAVPGALTKGDIDIELRVRTDAFAAAESALARVFAPNLEMRRAPIFSYFADDAERFPLGILLTAPAPENDVFRAFRDALRSDCRLLHEYNELKRRAAGERMEIYRSAKTAFIERVIGLHIR